MVGRAGAGLLGVVLSGCGQSAPEPTTTTQPPPILTDRYPELVVTPHGLDVVTFGTRRIGTRQQQVVFVENRGGLPMGIFTLDLQQKGTPDSFTVGPFPDDVDGLRWVSVAEHGAIPVLDPGSAVPITITFAPAQEGDLFAALEVRTAREPIGQPTFFGDPRNPKSVTILQGWGAHEHDAFRLSAARLNFGSVAPLEISEQTLTIENVSDGPLTLDVELNADDCDRSFQLDLDAFYEGPLAPGEHTPLTVRFAPATPLPASCTVTVSSAAQVADVLILGNIGAGRLNRSPVVEIQEPSTGAVFAPNGVVRVSVLMSDPDQPASSLGCRVRAQRQRRTVAYCAPPDDRGLVTVEIPGSAFAVGPESLWVEVTDEGGRTARASVPVRIGERALMDADGDGFDRTLPGSTQPLDCDDQNPAVYPDAVEQADGLDNDCDEMIDEDTDLFDDDRDGFSEEEGDCDDVDDSVYPDAEEIPDARDNDCDGIVDERTPRFDDDLDGFSEEEGDCDDQSPDAHPGGREICDVEMIDEDCDGAINRADPEGCAAILGSKPRVIGGCILDDRALNAGETTTATMFVYDADTPAADLRFDWVVSPEAEVTVHNPTAALTAVTWDLDLAVPDGTRSRSFLVYALVFDGPLEDEPGQDWCSDEIDVYGAGTPLELERPRL
ncbi:MAG: MopE-related protein [Myxococcota bacterium]